MSPTSYQTAPPRELQNSKPLTGNSNSAFASTRCLFGASEALVRRFFSVVLALLVLIPLASAKDQKLDPLLHAIEQRYNKAQTLSLHFTESYIAGKRTKRTESGTLELRKPGRMRWNYDEPAGKLFLSDGKHLYMYKPETKQVEKTSLKDSEDLRAPLAFLLGKLNFYREFSGFESRTEGSDTWVTARSNSADLPYSEVEFLVTPDARIRRLRVINDDMSVLDFSFDQEVINPRLEASRFVFQLPPGAELVETSR
jgi:outer membrane lipoprotein carrier protein